MSTTAKRSPASAARLEHDERDLPIGALLIVPIAAVEVHDLGPEPLPLLSLGDSGAHGAALRADLDRRLGVLHQVVKPGGIARVPALGGNEHDVLSVLQIG